MSNATSSSDYLRPSGQQPNDQQSERMMNQVSEVADNVRTFVSDIGETIKERPYTMVAIAGGLAFAVGALWMVRRHQPRSSYEALFSRLPDLPDRRMLSPGNWTDYWPRSWERYWRQLAGR